jgi:hypothetical protein
LYCLGKSCKYGADFHWIWLRLSKLRSAFCNGRHDISYVRGA